MQLSRRTILQAGALAATTSLLFNGAALADSTLQRGRRQAPQANGDQLVVTPLADRRALRVASAVLTPYNPPVLVLVMDDGSMLDIGIEARRQRVKLPFDTASMLSLIKAGPAAMTQLRQLAERAQPGRANYLPVKDAIFVAPLARPAGATYRVDALGASHPADARHPRAVKGSGAALFFTRDTSPLAGPFATLPLPNTRERGARLDWEASMVVIIGRAGRNIRYERAMEYVFGYSLANDIRDDQGEPGTVAMGPWIVSGGDIDMRAVSVVGKLNGKQVQQVSGSDLTFPLARLISELSRSVALQPGDIVIVGDGNARAEHLRAGDVLETAIDGIGMIRNTVE